MSCDLIKDTPSFVETLSGIAPLFISLGVAWVAYLQFKINKDKLRLDLYNRRFEIFSKTMNLQSFTFQNYLGTQIDLNKENEACIAFIKAYRESKFLFPTSSNVDKLLEEFSKDVFEVLEFGRDQQKIKKISPDDHRIAFDRTISTLSNLNKKIDKLEKAMAPYLNFHKTYF